MLRIKEIIEALAPEQVHREYPMTARAAKTISETRRAIHNILHGGDDRLLVVIGPCSIHDLDAALEYATRLNRVRNALADDLLIVMRIYFEKSRTALGWKGFINDPNLDDSFQIDTGLRLARGLLCDVNNMGVPGATEFLGLLTPQYVSDLISWATIGARTAESQVHRELASGLSCPVGFKNGTDGNIQIAIDAVRSASHPHRFLSLNQVGRPAIFATRGNQDCHIILRGGNVPNYDAASVERAAKALEAAGQRARLMIDFSHGNSQKQHHRQLQVSKAVAAQVASGDYRIIGTMIESHLRAGRQDTLFNNTLVYGQSITDACIGWDDSVFILEQLAEAVCQRRAVDRL
jgi:3-deoxy-7-phosphoheptulonate synthase